LDQLMTGYLRACGVPHRRAVSDGHIRYKLSPSPHLPEGWQSGGAVVIGRTKDLDDSDPLHLGHPLVQAAVEEARTATARAIHVAWKLAKNAPPQLKQAKGKRGRLALSRARYHGFESVDRLMITAVLEGDEALLSDESARWLLQQSPENRSDVRAPVNLDVALEDAIELQLFQQQAEVTACEQQRFERNLEQIDRYVEDQLLVLKKRLRAESEAFREAEARRDAAMGSEARNQAEARINKIQAELDRIEAEIERLERRNDEKYEAWRIRAHDRRYRPPEVTRLMNVEFVLE
jgi:hypothetical protein